jgi:hypothetical protein
MPIAQMYLRSASGGKLAIFGKPENPANLPQKSRNRRNFRGDAEIWRWYRHCGIPSPSAYVSRATRV